MSQVPLQEGLVATNVWSADGLPLAAPFRHCLSWKTRRQRVIEGTCGRLTNGRTRRPHLEPVNLLPDGKRSFANVIMLRALDGEISWIIQVDARCNHKGPCKREAGGSETGKECDNGSRERDLMTGAGVEGMHFTDGGRAASQGMQATSRSWKRWGNRFSPLPPEGTQICQHLDLSSVRPF